MTKKLLPILMLVAVFATSCGNKPAKMLQKTWNLTDVQVEVAAQQEDIKAAMQGATLTFKKDGTYSFDLSNPANSQSGAYTLNKEGTTLTLSPSNGAPEVHTTTITKTSLNLSKGGDKMTFTAK